VGREHSHTIHRVFVTKVGFSAGVEKLAKFFAIELAVVRSAAEESIELQENDHRWTAGQFGRLVGGTLAAQPIFQATVYIANSPLRWRSAQEAWERNES